ncbi:DUF3134 family protein [Lyngbya aestuarii]|uniref:DUF3134 family protein n=1 Tax=Lyngbya aestuarii TaxID=118322 RepID=UPI00403D685D
MDNPALRSEPRDQLAQVIPLQQETSLLDWLENRGRLLARDSAEDRSLVDADEEISELMGADDGAYEEDDDAEDLED